MKMWMLVALLVIAVGGTAWGLLSSDLEDGGVQRVANANNLLIVDVPEEYVKTGVIEGIDGVRTYRVEVKALWRVEEALATSVAVGKEAEVTTTNTELRGGKRYLVAGSRNAKQGDKPWCLTDFALLVPDDCDLRALEKRGMEDRVRAIMEARSKQVAKEIAGLVEERKKLDGWLKEDKR